jgi:hypothetical protein
MYWTCLLGPLEPQTARKFTYMALEVVLRRRIQIQGINMGFLWAILDQMGVLRLKQEPFQLVRRFHGPNKHAQMTGRWGSTSLRRFDCWMSYNSLIRARYEGLYTWHGLQVDRNSVL